MVFIVFAKYLLAWDIKMTHSIQIVYTHIPIVHNSYYYFALLSLCLFLKIFESAT